MQTLQVSNLRKGFGANVKRVEAVRGVSLSIAPGTILAFLGPNGAGKTTTIKMIAGLLLPDSGTVLIDGLDPVKNRSVFSKVGVVLEGSRNLYLQLTAQDNLEYFGVIKGLPASQIKPRAAELLSFFNLTDKANTRVSELSSGMQQKLTIAVALMNKPTLLLLDEPTNALDVESAEDIKDLMRKLSSEGLSILLTTHQLDVAQQVAHNIAIIRSGEIILQSDIKSLLKRFEGDFYNVAFGGTLADQQLAQLAAHGVNVDGQSLRFHGAPALVYDVLQILKPNALQELKRGDNDLSSIFLRLIKEDSNVDTL